MAPAGLAPSPPHVPKRRMAMGPSTMTRASRTTKSIMLLPMPVHTTLTRTPPKQPVCVTKPRLEATRVTGACASNSAAMRSARPASPTLRIRGASSAAVTCRW